jgi:uncharacterized membrane protein
MNATHLHLLVNHVSIVGCIFAVGILLYGILVKSRHTKMIAYMLMVVSGIAGIITFSTGEAAEETVEKIAGVSKTIIETHEEAAKIAVVLVAALGLFALAGLYIEWKSKPFFRKVSLFVLFAGLICSAFLIRVGLLGGEIRHTELTNGATQVNQAQKGAGLQDED